MHWYLLKWNLKLIYIHHFRYWFSYQLDYLLISKRQKRRTCSVQEELSISINYTLWLKNTKNQKTLVLLNSLSQKSNLYSICKVDYQNKFLIILIYCFFLLSLISTKISIMITSKPDYTLKEFIHQHSNINYHET